MRGVGAGGNDPDFLGTTGAATATWPDGRAPPALKADCCSGNVGGFGICRGLSRIIMGRLALLEVGQRHVAGLACLAV